MLTWTPRETRAKSARRGRSGLALREKKRHRPPSRREPPGLSHFRRRALRRTPPSLPQRESFAPRQDRARVVPESEGTRRAPSPERGTVSGREEFRRVFGTRCEMSTNATAAIAGPQGGGKGGGGGNGVSDSAAVARRCVLLPRYGPEGAHYGASHLPAFLLSPRGPDHLPRSPPILARPAGCRAS